MLTVKEAADRMRVSSGLVYSLCVHRQLRHSRVGLGRGKIVIPEEAVAEYLRGREGGPVERLPPPAPAERKPPPLRLRHLRRPGA
jgi:excisionase family DNA binding protein